ncbi:MAG: hypothetical protein ATN33_08850 [Epulopiscium sp. Nele67-Bin001]|nr:MAG: hypothetical protein ATN33_08850 [Epulopiscium sp. Nele67-Bin001]
MNEQVIINELKVLAKKEAKYINKNLNKNFVKIEGWVEQKIPDKLQSSLEAAIFTSFGIVFQKGTDIIEKGYNKSALEFNHKMNTYALSIRPNKKSIKRFKKTSNTASIKNIAISGTKGVGFGILGIGLPDIPVFISVMLKGVYEIATAHGYDYNLPYERYFILQLITVAFSYDIEKLENVEEINKFAYDNILSQTYDEEAKIIEVSELLTNDLIYTKFIQGIPFVGVLGGTFDMLFTKKVLDYAQIKYQQRFFHRLQAPQQQLDEDPIIMLDSRALHKLSKKMPSRLGLPLKEDTEIQDYEELPLQVDDDLPGKLMDKLNIKLGIK